MTLSAIQNFDTQETEQGTAVYGATQTADLTEMEFKQQYLGLRVNWRARNGNAERWLYGSVLHTR